MGTLHAIVHRTHVRGLRHFGFSHKFARRRSKRRTLADKTEQSEYQCKLANEGDHNCHTLLVSLAKVNLLQLVATAIIMCSSHMKGILVATRLGFSLQGRVVDSELGFEHIRD